MKTLTTADVDARSKKLYEDFEKIEGELRDRVGEPDTKRHGLMVSWLVQKVAGLQVIVEYQNSQINELRRRTRK
jgi:hypothetical protein